MIRIIADIARAQPLPTPSERNKERIDFSMKMGPTTFESIDLANAVILVFVLF